MHNILSQTTLNETIDIRCKRTTIMNDDTFNIEKDDINQWITVHKDAIKITIIGDTNPKCIHDIGKVLMHTTIKHYDLKDVKFNEDYKVDDTIEACWNDDFDEMLIPLDKMMANKSLAKEFIVEDSYTLSIDKKVLVNLNTDIIPPYIEFIGNYCGYRNNLLKTIIIPDSVKSIGYMAFADCENLCRVIMSNSVEHLASNTFCDCYELSNVTLPDNLEEIPTGCFTNCDILIDESIFPQKIKRIGEFAFDGNLLYDKIKIPEGVEEILSSAIPNETGTRFLLPSTLHILARDFCFSDDAIKAPFIEIHPDNPYFFAIDGTLYSRQEPDRPYLEHYNNPGIGMPYLPPPPEPSLIIFPENARTPLPVEELKAMFPPYNCKAINSSETLFWIYDFEGTITERQCYTIIDRSLHSYIPKNNRINFSKDNFVIIEDINYNHHVYSIDLKTELLTDDETHKYCGCDDEGRIYLKTYDPNRKMSDIIDDLYSKGIDGKWGCVDIEGSILIPPIYEEINGFHNGISETKLHGKWGVINTFGEIVIPFKYKYFYARFNDDGICIVTLKKSFQYLNIKDENLGIFVQDSENENIWESGFHIFKLDNSYGYSYQFGLQRQDPIYQNIKKIDKYTLEVSIDGLNYETIHYN